LVTVVCFLPGRAKDLSATPLISIAVDGTNDDMLWNVRSEWEGDEGTDCEDGDSDTGW